MRTNHVVRQLLLFAGIPLLGAASALAFSPQGDAASLATRLKSALTPLPHSQTVYGACVIDLSDGRTVFAANADTPLIPASTMKIFAMLAALVELGPDFEFQTVLATDGLNLYVIGDGDPGFGDERLHTPRGEDIHAPFDRWATRLLARGHATIPGSLVIDESIFEGQHVHPSWEAEDLGKWYAAPVAALNINDNCLDITIVPGARPGDRVSVSSIRPDTKFVNFINECRTGDGQPVLHHPFGTRDYKTSGKCNKRWTFGPVAFSDPGLLFADAMRTRLGRKGIRIEGEIVRRRMRLPSGALPDSLTIVDRHATPIGDCLSRAGKDSQNLFAECLLKRAGYAMARRDGVDDPRGSWELGGSAVLKMAYAAGIALPGLRVADGSGLSRQNTATAQQLASILVWANRQPFREAFYQNLAKAGVDGSLRTRLKNLDARVYAKTGTMRGVRTLAGYVGNESGPRYAFAVMFNGYPGPSTPYREIQDRFCRILSEACEKW